MKGTNSLFMKNYLQIKRRNTKHSIFNRINKGIYTAARVSMVQRPGESKYKNVTLIPGYGIGEELASKYNIPT